MLLQLQFHFIIVFGDDAMRNFLLYLVAGPSIWQCNSSMARVVRALVLPESLFAFLYVAFVVTNDVVMIVF